ncbi:MAG: DUF6519 domain-containing protein, partial [Paracoccaceae bacterium]|nr:DUF6519 domain-containing protein [Paracoccaceae bacterium]
MKAQISRISHDPAQDYSGVFHVQGGLITDADLNEQTEIARDRTDLLGRDAVRGGSPALGGIADLAVAPLKLVPGAIYAGGLRGMLRSASALNGADPLDLIRKQADLPGVYDPAAVTAEQVVYADIWHRPVSAAEDPGIAEVALHGAIPSFRSRTVTQLRLAPAAKAPAILTQTADFPAIGTGRLTVTATGNAEAADPCDPCATEVNLGVALENAL